WSSCAWARIHAAPKEGAPMARRKPPLSGRRSPKAGHPPEETTLSTRVRRRRKTAHVAVRKDTTVFQTPEGPRKPWRRARRRFKERGLGCARDLDQAHM